MSITTRLPLDIDALFLAKGSHTSPEKGLCFIEAAAYFAGKPHTDHPPCVCPVIAAFGRRWNDDLDDAGRQRLKRFIPLILDTKATKEIETKRAWLVTDWMVRVHTPAWLRLGGMEEQAAKLEALPPLLGDKEARASQVALNEAHERASAAWSAARSAAGNAAWSAAWNAAWSAAGSAAGSAAWSAAGSAAGNAAWSAAWSAARSAAGNAAWSAAWNAARSAAGSAAGNAAGSAAGSALAPTVKSLQASAEDLLERLIACGRGAQN